MIPIDGGNITHVISDTGPNLIWNTGGREPVVSLGGVLVKYLAQYYKALLWDRHNNAESSDLYLSENRDTLPPIPMTSVN